MARKRMIDPEFWSDEQVGKWSPWARLFYIGLWNFADDQGRFKAHNVLLQSQIFPYDGSAVDINRLKKELGDKIEWYTVDGSQYGYVRKFNIYQKIDRPTTSKLPAPPSFDESSSSDRRDVPDGSCLIEEKRRERKAPQITDADFIKTLKNNPAYKGIDIDRELGKMDAWLLTPKGKGRQKTRRFVVNWLNKIDKPMEKVGPAAVSSRPFPVKQHYGNR